MVPFLDLRAAYLELKAPVDAAVSRVLDSGHYILGPEVEQFEQAFAEYSQARYAIGVGNGLDALQLSLVALGVAAGDEVLVPSNTYIATWLAVSHLGATPVAVEPCPLTHTMDPARIEEAITERTRVILPVHLYGRPAELTPILSIAGRHNLAVLEDAAQAHGARYQDRRIGAHGSLVAWSFYPGKNLGALGDGGAITTDDETLAMRLRALRNYGSTVKYVNEMRGYNSRLDPLQAAVLRAKLSVLDQWQARRQQVARRYLEGIANPLVTPPAGDGLEDQAWHLFVVRCRQRDLLQRHLAAQGIETLIHYPIPPHHQQAYSQDFATTALPLASQLAAEVLSLPMSPHMDESQISAVIAAVNQFGG